MTTCAMSGDINTRLRIARTYFRLTQTELGRRLGVTGAAVCGWETRGRSVPRQMIRAICRELKISETWVRTGDGDMLTGTSCAEDMHDAVYVLMEDAPDSFKAALVQALLALDAN